MGPRWGPDGALDVRIGTKGGESQDVRAVNSLRDTAGNRGSLQGAGAQGRSAASSPDGRRGSLPTQAGSDFIMAVQAGDVFTPESLSPGPKRLGAPTTFAAFCASVCGGHCLHGLHQPLAASELSRAAKERR